MEKLLTYIQERVVLREDEIQALKEIVQAIEIPAKTILIQEGKRNSNLYFVNSGIVSGYTLAKGKKHVEHLIGPFSFFASMEGFMQEEHSLECFETVSNCELYRIAKSDFNALRNSGGPWDALMLGVMNENLKCKMERTADFQQLTAKERYLKFIKDSPDLLRRVSIETIASFLGMEPQSLSRIRREIIS